MSESHGAGGGGGPAGPGVIADFLDRAQTGRYVAAVREQVRTKQLRREKVIGAAKGVDRDHADGTQARAAVLDALRQDDTETQSSGWAGQSSPFLSRSPAVSLLQTSLEDEARKHGIVHTPAVHRRFGKVAAIAEEIVRDLEAVEHKIWQYIHPEQFSTTDAAWVTTVAEAMLDRLAKGNRPFNPEPAHAEIDSANPRIVVVGDWGSGVKRAIAVAKQIAARVDEALGEKREVHVIHLGDVYYSGDAVEIELRVLADGMWPVTAAQAAGDHVMSWSLNGNHDMYSGGWGYFDTLLADPRFVNQSSAPGKPTSFFRIRTPSWDLVGLDTSWQTDPLSLAKSGVLEDPQATVLGAWAEQAEQDGRKLMLLSHHQLVTAYDHGDIATELPDKLAPLLARGQVAAWLWGHEHRCMGFTSAPGQPPFMRCIGHGGIPVLASDAPTPAPGSWRETGSFEENGDRWNNFGFAVLDFDGPAVSFTYFDDEGAKTRTEAI